LTRTAPARYRWRAADRNQLSPGGAIAIGLCSGLVFVLAGLAVIIGYGIAGGAAPDGDLLPGTPFGVRLVQSLLGLGIIAMLASIASWVAFGGGSRHFTSSGPLISAAVNEAIGRTVFGIGAALAWAFMAVMIVVSVKRLRRR
jgi:hypothetical protein